MNLLVDTHAYIWWGIDLNKLSASAAEALSKPESGIYVSVASLLIRPPKGWTFSEGRFLSYAPGAPLKVQTFHGRSNKRTEAAPVRKDWHCGRPKAAKGT